MPKIAFEVAEAHHNLPMKVITKFASTIGKPSEKICSYSKVGSISLAMVISWAATEMEGAL